MDNNPAAQADPSLAVLEESPQPATATFRGDAVAVLPLTLAKWPAFLRHLKPMLPQLSGAWAALEADQDSAVGMLVVDLIAEHGDSLYEAVALAIDKPVAWVRDTDDMGGLIEVVTTILMVNGDFFARQVVPRLAGLPAQLRTLVGTGQTPSTSSPAATH